VTDNQKVVSETVTIASRSLLVTQQSACAYAAALLAPSARASLANMPIHLAAQTTCVLFTPRCLHAHQQS
jgi:hypothetical protein